MTQVTGEDEILSPMGMALLRWLEWIERLQLNRWSPDFYVIDHPGIVERTKSDMSVLKGLIRSFHDRGLHVVEIDLNESCGCLTHETNVMPDFGAPLNAFSGSFRDLDSGRVVDDEYVVRVIIGRGRQVHVVEVCRVLVAEEEAHVAVAIFSPSLEEFHVEDEVSDEDGIDIGHIEGRPMGRLVLALLMELERFG